MIIASNSFTRRIILLQRRTTIASRTAAAMMIWVVVVVVALVVSVTVVDVTPQQQQHCATVPIRLTKQRNGPSAFVSAFIPTSTICSYQHSTIYNVQRTLTRDDTLQRRRRRRSSITTNPIIITTATAKATATTTTFPYLTMTKKNHVNGNEILATTTTTAASAITNITIGETPPWEIQTTTSASLQQQLPPLLPPTVISESASLTNTTTTTKEGNFSMVTQLLDTYWGPRIVLLLCAMIYSTNFALGSIMNEALPAAAVTASRMTFATMALLPFLPNIQSKFIVRSILTGVCAAVGYVTQSIALTDTDPARVSFLGAATVLWLPILEATIDKVPMSITEAPQTWLAAILCLVGVGILELYDPGSSAGVDTSVVLLSQGIHMGDILALLQAIGFGTGAFLSSKMIREDPDQVFSITSVIIATTAVLAWIWCLVTGSTTPLFALLQSDPIHTNLPIVLAVLWTGVVSTSLIYVIEIAALGRVPPAEASVLLASEPIWAAIFAAFLIGETLGTNDYIGGSCIVAACCANALLKPQDILNLLSNKEINDTKE
jgi:drug/metabolite transporter (DMT)-like permease